MKVVINKRHGGFGLSDAAMNRYAEIKGITLYPEKTYTFTIYYTVPADQRFNSLTGDCKEHSVKDRIEVLSEYDMDRNDPILIQVVEEFGKEANGHTASLKVVEIPDDVKWHIHEYDGLEHVAEDHRTWS